MFVTNHSGKPAAPQKLFIIIRYLIPHGVPSRSKASTDKHNN